MISKMSISDKNPPATSINGVLVTNHWEILEKSFPEISIHWDIQGGPAWLDNRDVRFYTPSAEYFASETGTVEAYGGPYPGDGRTLAIYHINLKRWLFPRDRYEY